MRVGILMTDGLGDVLCATGMVADIRAAWPEAYVCAVVRTDAARSFFRGRSRIDAFIRYDPAEGNTPGRVLSLLRALRRERFDVFVVATDIDCRKAPCLAFATGAQVRVGEAASHLARLYTRSVPRNPRQHKVISNRQIVALLGISAGSSPSVEIAPSDADHAARLLSDLGLESSPLIVAVHPGSSEALRHKRWGVEQYEQLLGTLGQGGARVILLGFGPEVGLCDRLASSLGSLAVSLAGQLALGQTAAVLQRSSVAIGGDSGVMHLAAAVGTPTIALFGPTDDRRTAPFAARQILVADVSCRPCFDHLPYGCGAPICMSGISVGRVYAAVREVVGEARLPQAQVPDSLSYVD